jgi:hypothetical protein
MPNDTARLQSILVPSVPAEKCLTFYYHMFGKHIGALNVFIKDMNGNEYSVWSKSGDQGNVSRWKLLY